MLIANNLLDLRELIWISFPQIKADITLVNTIVVCADQSIIKVIDLA
ncbi:hypothetical protein SAMN04488023_106136 [Pedobacter rhizosphaerae]|uniref:Uncharacterized protein n=1 Tax=Pedobacter rhizosphaerae TaxID=390241 RepID=A0A1H9MTF7_9SPHI|nr:hypothetical protein SAMN04488023_106136 [Pedobacter rhizosphaerae]